MSLGKTLDPLEVRAELDQLLPARLPADAACKDQPEISSFREPSDSAASARAVCARCFVREECAD